MPDSTQKNTDTGESQSRLVDIGQVTVVGFQVELHEDHVKIWLCVDGTCRIRIAKAKNLDVDIPGHPKFRFGRDFE